MKEQETKNPTMPELNVSVRLLEPQGNLLGFASVTLNDCLVVDGFSIMQGKNGIFVNMPSRPDESATNGYRETVRPITADFRNMLQAKICDAYFERIELIQAQAKAHAGHLPKESLATRLDEGKQKAERHNAKAERPAPEKEATVAV